MTLLPRTPAAAVSPGAAGGLTEDARRVARETEERLIAGGEAALRELAEQWGEVPAGAPLLLGRPELEEARAALAPHDERTLVRLTDRVEAFARAQRAAVSNVSVDFAGGRAGHRVLPVARVGAYAPGGRYPLPSSVIMTTVPARVAGVDEVWVASPRPHLVVLAAAAIAGADGVLCAGGAHGILALARGIAFPGPCDVVVGPGNAWVTAAKERIAGRTRIDGLAGPSELLLFADDTMDPAAAAADLLAQAEHDPEAVVVLVARDDAVLARITSEVDRQLSVLPTAEVARRALARGASVLAESDDEVVALIDRFAPEHLQLGVRDPEAWRDRLRFYGAAFLGPRTSTVLGDYGAGPNHTLPTGGAARATSGLSVLDFLRFPTWVAADAGTDDEVYRDAERVAGLEGLAGHAEAAARRLRSG